MMVGGRGKEADESRVMDAQVLTNQSGYLPALRNEAIPHKYCDYASDEGT
jgi:hypothetical protein